MERAEEYANRALAIDPNFNSTREARAMLYGLKYDYHRAAEEAREEIRLNPNDGAGWGSLAWALTYQQPPDPIEAEKAARESIRLYPVGAHQYYFLGLALLQQKRYPEALDTMEEVRRMAPDSPLADNGTAQVFLAEGQYARALTLMQKQPRTLHPRALEFDLRCTSPESIRTLLTPRFRRLKLRVALAALQTQDG